MVHTINTRWNRATWSLVGLWGVSHWCIRQNSPCNLFVGILITWPNHRSWELSLWNSLFTWYISLWPNCGFWSIVAFIFCVTLKSVAFLSVTQKIESHNRPKATIWPHWNVPCKQAKSGSTPQIYTFHSRALCREALLLLELAAACT